MNQIPPEQEIGIDLIENADRQAELQLQQYRRNLQQDRRLAYAIQAPKRSYKKTISSIAINKLISNPFSYVGLKLSMNSSFRRYYGALDCADSIIVHQGVLALWRGFPLDVASVFFTNIFCFPSKQNANYGILKKIFWNFFCINLTYCRFLYKLNGQMTIQKLPEMLVKAYTHKNGLIGLAGAAIIVCAQNIFRALLNTFRFQPSIRIFGKILNRGLQMTLFIYPWICIGCKMIERSFKSDTNLSNWSFKGLWIACLGAILQSFIPHLFN